MKTLLLLICMLGLIPVIFAQKGDYAVANQGDTVWGKHRTNLLGVDACARSYRQPMVRAD